MCGIFGIINHHKRQLDKRAFVTLGCVNDTRGGDSCGIMIDRQVEKGTEADDQLFQLWYPKSKLLADTAKCYVALGHCRKASSGGVAADKAHPITIHDKNGVMQFCLVHNGTIYNYEELAKKYIPDIDIKGMSDSQVMAQIFYHKGYDVLGEYNGGGAFVIHDYRTNETLMFKGESIGSLTTNKLEEERPLFFVQTGKSVIFSSMYAPLQGLYHGFEAYIVPTNILIRCDGLKLYKVKEYDRTKCYGCRKATSVTVYKGHYGSENEYLFDEDATYGYRSDNVVIDLVTGLYYANKNQEILHGVQKISRWGYMATPNATYGLDFYFWRGIMLSGLEAYNAVRRAHADGMCEKDLMNLARRLSCNPVAINKKYYTYTADNKKVYFEDEEYFFPLTHAKVFFGKKGRILKTFKDNSACDQIPAELSKPVVDRIVNYVEKSIQRN